MNLPDLSVLVIEDDPLDAELTVAELAIADGGRISVSLESSLTSGLRVLARQAVDAVLLDLSLSDSKGVASVQRVVRAHPDVAVIVLTGADDHLVALEAMVAGAQGYLVKGEGGGHLLLRTLLYGIERQKVRRQLREARSSLARIVESNADGMVVLDSSGGVKLMNPSAERMLGHNQGGLLDESVVLALLRRGEMTITDAHDEQAVLEIRSVAIEWEGEPATLASLRDVTARRRAEDMRRRLESAVEQAAEAIVVTDRDAKIEYLNPAFEAITGYSRDEVLGRKPSILQSGQHDEEFYHALWQTLLSGSTWRGRFVNRRKDGSTYQEDSTISPILDGDDIVAYVGVKRDVTEQLRVQDQLRQSQKLEALATLAGGVAHDFNNVLQSILGYTEMAQAKVEGGSAPARYLDKVMAAGLRARSLVSQILTFSSRQASERVPVAVGSVAGEALEMLRAVIPATIEIQHSIDPECGTVMADPTQIHQIVVNLCTNAYQAMSAGTGVLEVRLERLDPADEIPVDLDENPGGFLVLTVRDSGEGIDQEILDRIFEPFFTTKKDDKGTGLGLATVHGIATTIGGQVTVESQLGEGTVFRVFLPRSAEAGESRLGGGTAITASRQARIFVVDDEQDIAELEGLVLEELGHEVRCFADPRVLFEAFAADPAGVDLVVSDQTMPQRTGLELATELHRLRPGLPVLLVSGFSDRLTPEALAAAGVSEVLQKPVESRDLLRAVEECLSSDSLADPEPGSDSSLEVDASKDRKPMEARP